MNKIIVTTSWDDNHPQNLKLAKLLNQYNIKGTFYLTKFNQYETPAREIQEISSCQEVGVHTLTHPKLTEISLSEAREEIKGGKDYLEKVVGKEIKMFSYPYGLFNQEIKDLVKEAGFLGARTIEKFVILEPRDFFEFDTTLQIYPFPLRKRDAKHFHLTRHLFDSLINNFSGIRKLNLPLKCFLNWRSLAKSSFDFVVKKGGIWHLWGHSAELEKYNLWQDLEEILKYIADKKEVLYFTNSQVLEYFI
jgi:peptidoglycan/xylan/chitin deacetylase (PgdA/CDA1 family)